MLAQSLKALTEYLTHLISLLPLLDASLSASLLPRPFFPVLLFEPLRGNQTVQKLLVPTCWGRRGVDSRGMEVGMGRTDGFFVKQVTTEAP